MSLKCRDIIKVMENLAHPKHAEAGDQIGLQIGDPEATISKVLVTLDINLEVAQEAISHGVELIILHHTPLFKPLKSIRWDTPQGKMIQELIKNNINLYCAHTNLDSCPGGINDILARHLGLEQVQVLRPSWQEQFVKIVVFVPVGYQEQVRDALASAGAGWIGDYSHCTFQLLGTGTFLPLEGTSPFIGQKGQLEKVEEYRLETIVPTDRVKEALRAMVNAHPYEEVAYDVYPLNNSGQQTGLGRIGFLKKAMTLEEVTSLLKTKLGVRHLRFVGDLQQTIRKVALCGGSGASLMNDALIKGADLYITGDIKYHEAQEGQTLGLALIDPGHFATENPVVEMVASYLWENLQDQVQIVTSKVNTDPFRFI